MFEKYDKAARRAIFFGRHEALARKEDAIAPEHLLLGILRDEADGPSPAWPPAVQPVALLRADLESRCRPVDSTAETRDIPLTIESKRVLMATNASSERLGQELIGVGHMLLGLLTYETLDRTLSADRVSVKTSLAAAGFTVAVLEDHVRTLGPVSPMVPDQLYP